MLKNYNCTNLKYQIAQKLHHIEKNLTTVLKSAPQNYPENALKPNPHEIHLKLLSCGPQQQLQYVNSLLSKGPKVTAKHKHFAFKGLPTSLISSA